MKQDSLQQLLAKYQQGTLDDGELELLNALTHRDEVLYAAEKRAQTIVRRRTIRTVGLAVAAVAVLGSGIWMLTPKAEEPLLADAGRGPAVENLLPDNVDDMTDAAVSPKDDNTVMVAANRPRKAESREAAQPYMADPVPAAVEPLQEPTAERMARPAEAGDSEPIVVCNNQCDADSVISDIWKFLSA